MIIPVRQPYRVTSDAREHVARPSTLCGIDFIATRGRPDLLAMAGGAVKYVHEYNPKYRWGPGWDSLGRFVVIETRIDAVTVWLRYAHCERVDARAGDQVLEGQCIGEYGDTGASYGAHVHVDAWVCWGDLDKAALLGLLREHGLRAVPPWPGIPISLYNVNPTGLFARAGLDVINTGGR